MVAQHFRWDFIGLSTDTKPTPESNTKVTDGSTYYCSDTSKLYVWCYDNWYERKPLGGGGGGPTVVQTTGTSTTDVMSQNAVTQALASAGGDTVYSDKNTSASTTGGAVYIGNLNANQEEQPDPSTTDSHFRYFWALPESNNEVPQGTSINIFGQNSGNSAITLGANSIARLDNQIAIGANTLNNYSATSGIAIGLDAQCLNANAVAIGRRAKTTRDGEVNVGAGTSGNGYNNTDYRVIGGVHDPVDAHDAATKGYVDSQAGGGGITELTSADYNYPAGNPTSVAMWLKSAGIYKVTANTQLSFNVNTMVSLDEGTLITVEPKGSSVAILYYDPYLKVYYTQVSTGNGSVYEVVNTLTSQPFNASGSPLSAKQGKVLYDYIGDLTSLTTTDKTSLVNAINELAGRISTLEGN